MHGGGRGGVNSWKFGPEKRVTLVRKQEREHGTFGTGNFLTSSVTTVGGRFLNAIQSFISIRVGSECSPELISTVHSCNCMPIRLHRLSSESLVN